MELIDTEEKAKKRWCPEARAVAVMGKKMPDQPTRNIEIENGITVSKVCCLGSGCMMFRYDGNTSQFYCGKAGKP